MAPPKEEEDQAASYANAPPPRWLTGVLLSMVAAPVVGGFVAWRDLGVLRAEHDALVHLVELREIEHRGIARDIKSVLREQHTEHKQFREDFAKHTEWGRGWVGGASRDIEANTRSIELLNRQRDP